MAAAKKNTDGWHGLLYAIFTNHAFAEGEAKTDMESFHYQIVCFLALEMK